MTIKKQNEGRIAEIGQELEDIRNDINDYYTLRDSQIVVWRTSETPGEYKTLLYRELELLTERKLMAETKR